MVFTDEYFFSFEIDEPQPWRLNKAKILPPYFFSLFRHSVTGLILRIQTRWNDNLVLGFFFFSIGAMRFLSSGLV